MEYLVSVGGKDQCDLYKYRTDPKADHGFGPYEAVAPLDLATRMEVVVVDQAWFSQLPEELAQRTRSLMARSTPEARAGGAGGDQIV